jgi:hypothetical protein
MLTSQDLLDLQLPSSGTMRFVPVYLGRRDRAIWQPNLCKSFALSPSSWPIDSPEATQFTDAPAASNRLDIEDLAQKLYFH